MPMKKKRNPKNVSHKHKQYTIWLTPEQHRFLALHGQTRGVFLRDLIDEAMRQRPLAATMAAEDELADPTDDAPIDKDLVV